MNALWRLVPVSITLFVVAVLVGCGAIEGALDGAGEYAESLAEPEPAPESAMEPPVDRGAGNEAPAPPQVVEDAVEGQAVPAASTPARERLRVYSADLELVVPSLGDARQRIIDQAEGVGGYVESSSAEMLVIRVPAERFDDSLEAIEELGDVRSRVVSTSDVTEQFSDLARRIELARATRERLYRLLERTSDTDERVQILREIRRLIQTIETLESELESLDLLIRFSRITVFLVSRIADVQDQRSSIPFGWIAWLDPLQRTTGPADNPIVTSFPEDYAVLDEGRYVSLETAEGTRVRIGAVINEPAGDTQFWDEALRFHLGKLYIVAEPVEQGALRGALFESKAADPYFYLVAVGVDEGNGEEIVVAEAFFPDDEALHRRLTEISEIIRGVEL